MTITPLKSVRDWLRTCPTLSLLSRLNIDVLPSDEGAYSVEEMPAAPIVRQFLDGSSERQLLFAIRARFAYSVEAAQAIENLELFDAIQSWMDEQCSEGNLPTLSDGCTATKVEATTYGYLFDVEDSVGLAVYQIQCRLSYDKEC